MRWDAESYDSVKAPQIEAGKELGAMAEIGEHHYVLDIGCGTGKLTLDLARLAYRGEVIGVDPSAEMLHKAEEVAAKASNIRFMRGSAESMDFVDQFDLVFSNSALQWVKDQPQAIAGTFRALKPGGKIAFQLPAKNFCREFFKYAEHAIAILKLERFYKDMEMPWFLPSKEEYECLLVEAGFSAVNVFYRDYRLSFDSIAEIMDWWSSAGLRPYLAALPEKEQGYFGYAVGMQYEQNWTGKNYAFDFRRLFAFAEKEE